MAHGHSRNYTTLTDATSSILKEAVLSIEINSKGIASDFPDGEKTLQGERGLLTRHREIGDSMKVALAGKHLS
jgi:hypothetical protein